MWWHLPAAVSLNEGNKLVKPPQTDMLPGKSQFLSLFLFFFFSFGLFWASPRGVCKFPG